MSLVDDVFATAKQTATAIGKKSAEFYDLAKYKVKETELNGAIRKKFELLGKEAYDASKKGKDVEGGALVCEIDELLEKLQEVKDRIAEFKNIIRCESCDAYNPEGSKFCNECGASFSIDIPVDPVDSAE